MERVRVFGPAADMSVSSRGHYVQLQNGKFVRSTVIVIPTQTAETISEVREQGKELLNKDRQVEDAQGNAEEAPLDIGNQPAEEALKGSEFLEVDVKDVLMEEQSEQDQGEKGLRFGNASAQLQRPKRTRLHKKSPPDSFYPELQDQKEHGSTSTSLCRLQGWGEWGEDQMMQDMEVWQHQELKDKLQQSWSDWLESVGGGDSGQKLQEMEQFKIEAETLERILEKKEDQVQAKMRALTVQVEKEVLQTRVVSMEEVRAHPEEWKEAFQKEYNTLSAGPVVPISQQEFEDLVTSKTELEILPMKGVATLKPPNRHKARIVVCGNYSTNVPDVDISVGGVCATTIRAAAHVSVVRGWQMGSIDVASAFLQAPRRNQAKVVITEPPSILRALNITSPGERWQVQSALYGMIDSPADWASFHDDDLARMTWTDKGQTLSLKQTSERHLWEVRCNQDEVVGNVLVYVDDLLVTAESKYIKGLFDAIKATWKCSDEEMVTDDRWMGFCGYEFRRSQQGLLIGQMGYTADLLKRRKITETEDVPIQKIIEDKEEEEKHPDDLKKAQALVGELMWLSNRTRGDIAFAIGAASRILHKRPKYACSIAENVLKYINKTKNYVMEYLPEEAAKKRNSKHLPEPRDWKKLEIYSDASFAPPHEGHRSIQGAVVEHCGNVLAWTSTRQAFVTQSTAESELVAFNEAYQVGESTAALLSMFKVEVERLLYGDNRAALSLCSAECGSWRTRHLRLRSAKLREALMEEGGNWRAKHLPGGELVADGLTKGLVGQSFVQFRSFLGLREFQSGSESAVGRVRRLGHVIPQVDRLRQICRVLLVAGSALISSGQQLLQHCVFSCTVVSKGGNKSHRQNKTHNKTATRPKQ